MRSTKEIIQQQAEQALHALNVQGHGLAAEVADSVLRQAVYWEKPLPNGNRLLFMRLFSPVVMRQEIFLGNVLFNAFLGQAFTRAVQQVGGTAAPVANDLENYYFLICTSTDLPVLAKTFRAEVEHSLPELFFGKPNPARGIFGELGGMFTFRKSDFEPFPVYAVPQFLDRHLERAIRREVKELLQPQMFKEEITPRTVLTALAFFYGRTSGGVGDAQSFANFIEHLTNEPGYDGLLSPDKVKKAFNIDYVSKNKVKQSLDDKNYSKSELRQLAVDLLADLTASIDSGSDKWRLGFLRSAGKFISTSPEEYLALLFSGAQLGYLQMSTTTSGTDIPCRLCHKAAVAVEDRYIVTGLTSFKFHNQSVRKSPQKLCARCALYSYLTQKLLGTAMVLVGGKLPQIPKNYNIIFHYGKHSDAEVAHLVQQIDRVWELVRQHRDTTSIRREVTKAYEALAQKTEQQRDAKKRAALQADLARTQAELQQAQAAVAQVEVDIFAECPWMRDLDSSPVPSENPALDVIGNLQLSDSRVERHVLGLGMGGYRMILFVMPQIRPPRDAKDQNFAQSRFSNSWVTVITFLSFLNQLCGCDGPFYYQSLPNLTEEAFQPGVFNVRNRSISAKDVQNKYAMISELAWQMKWRQGSKGFVEKVILAEKLLTDPLGMFSTIMRDSPILGQREGGYKKLKTEYRRDWGAQDLTEYARFIQQLTELWRVNHMAVKVDREPLDEFCPRLFRVLDKLGLLPKSLRDKPTAYEKYPRLLFGSIRRYNDVEAGFKEWESRVLRVAEFRKEEHYPELEALRQWMVKHADLFGNKANMQHLASSLYARVFQYLYPRRVLVQAYCLKHQGNLEALSADFLARQLPGSVADVIQKLESTYESEWDTIVADARQAVLENNAYYRKVMSGKEPLETLPEIEDQKLIVEEDEK
jgi:hypothetical protein